MRKKNFRRKRYARRDFYLPGIPTGVKIPENTPQALEMGLKYLKRQMKDTNTLGIYKENCGIENLHLSYGHDEYLYQVLLFNKNHKLSKKYLNIIRFHSFYPWHTEGEYKHFMNENDKNILNDILNFNQYDLYSKEDDTNIPETTKQYYFNLIDEFFDGDIYF